MCTLGIAKNIAHVASRFVGFDIDNVAKMFKDSMENFEISNDDDVYAAYENIVNSITG